MMAQTDSEKPQYPQFSACTPDDSAEDAGRSATPLEDLAYGLPEQPPDPLTTEHRQFLADAAIDTERMEGIQSVREPVDLPESLAYLWKHADRGAVVFPWTPVTGDVLPQLRLDNPPTDPDGKKKGYRFPKDSTMVLSVPPGYRDLVMDAGVPLVIVEGTKQHLAAASALAGAEGADRYAVVGISGCRGWQVKGGRAIPCLHQIPLDGRKVFIAFDADVTSNREVHDAATQLAETLTTEYLAGQVFFVLSGRSGKDGLDDILGGHPAGNRQQILLRMLAKAAPDRIPGRAPARPKARSAAAFFSREGNFLPVVMWDYLVDLHPMAITREATSTEKAMKGAVAVYEAGVYRNGESRHFQRSITRALANELSLGHIDLVTEIALNELTAAGRVIPERLDRLLVNCRNGLVDVMTGELLPHDPDVLTLFQVPLSYDPEAACPKYEAWMEERLPGQMAALEDVACQVLDMTRTPQRFLFLFGPKRSGKSTFLRIVTELVGKKNTSAVTLHQLSDDRFASANLYGKALNVAADLSSRDVKDLSSLKMLTGEDQVNANRKYGAQFTFTSQALLAFSANDVPTVNDPSGAYQGRAMPFHFAASFYGREDPKVEDGLIAEMPGILNRFVQALRAHRERGGYIGTDEATRDNFSRQSNRVKEYLDEMTRAVVRPEGTPRAILWSSWKSWAEENGYIPGGRNGFMEKVRSCGVDEFRPRGGSLSFAVQVIDPETHDEGGVDSSGGGAYDSSGPVGGKTVDGPKPSGGRGPGPVGDERSTVLGPVDSFSLSPYREDVSAGPSDKSPRPGCDKTVDGPENCRQTAPDSCETAVPATDSGRSTVLSPELSTTCPDNTASTVFGPEAPMVFDLETGSADQLFAPGTEGFVRLVGHTRPDGVVVTTDLAAVLAHKGPLVAHNGFGFDWLALARHHGFDLLQAGEQGRLIDTMVLAAMDRPPVGGDGTKAMKKWSLDYLGELLLDQRKSDSVVRLAKQHGGFDQIPTDDPEFRAYCQQDVTLTQGLLEHFAPGGQLTPYQAREMRLTARLSAGITLNGFRVDVDLLHQRIAEGQQVKDEGHRWLVETYGLPTTTADGKRQAKNPAGTAAGKEAIARAFADLGVTLPKTDKGNVSTGNDAMQALIESQDSGPAVVRLAEVVQRINGVRTVYQTVLDNLQGDRIHPQLFACQLNGRYSVRPGMTTFGKRGGKVVEREVFLPDSDDHVLIACDLSQIDARAVAVHCQDPAYMAMFDTDPATGRPRDIHTEVAMAIWGDAARRSDAKPINHGINYGMSATRLAQVTGQGQVEAIKTLAAFWRKFPILKNWQDAVRKQGEMGQPLDNGFGRKLRVNPERAYTQAPALVGCGCARDLMMEGILRLPVEIVPMLRMFVHDELIFSVPKADAPEIEQAILNALQFEWAPHEGMTPIRILADLGARGANWAQVYAKE
jgi:P4 family phage/plasmid primase-like protien